MHVHPRPFLLSPLLLLLACGPLAPLPGDGASTDTDVGDTTAGGDPPGPTATATSDDATTSASTGDADTTASDTTSGTTALLSTTTTDGASGSSSSSTTGPGDDLDVCYQFCETDPQHCPLEARVNATITGTTPLGPFTGTFAAFSGAIAFGDLGTLVVVPEYTDGDLCEPQPRLIFDLGPLTGDAAFVVQAPVRHVIDGGQFVDAVAEVHIDNCCQVLWFCECASATPFTASISIQADGWSLSGTVAPNCCRSRSVDEAA